MCLCYLKNSCQEGTSFPPTSTDTSQQQHRSQNRELNNLLYLPVSDEILLFDVINLTVKFHKSRHVSGSLKVSMTTERSISARGEPVLIGLSRAVKEVKCTRPF